MGGGGSGGRGGVGGRGGRSDGAMVLGKLSHRKTESFCHMFVKTK